MVEYYNELDPSTPDPIVAAAARWQEFLAAHPGAINLTIGVIINPATMRPYRPGVVQEAYPIALDQVDQDSNYGYQNAAGNAIFLDAFGRNLLGEEQYAANVNDMLAYQTLGGTGALWMAQEMLAKLIRRDGTGRVPLMLESGYPNHFAIFPDDQFNISTYQHADPATGAYNHQAALDAISAMPPGSVLLLQACGHNDDGADRTKQQWDEVLDAAQERNAVVVLDGAYIGLARGLPEDRYALTECARRGILTVVCGSTSKILGMYGERLGAMYILNASQHIGDKQFNNLDTEYKGKVRRTITGVPHLAAAAAAIALQDPRYVPQLEDTRLRVRGNRAGFSESAGRVALGAVAGWGMYARVLQEGFTPNQVAALNEHGLYVLPTSRMNFGGMRDREQAARIGLIVADVVRAA